VLDKLPPHPDEIPKCWRRRRPAASRVLTPGGTKNIAMAWVTVKSHKVHQSNSIGNGKSMARTTLMSWRDGLTLTRHPTGDRSMIGFTGVRLHSPGLVSTCRPFSSLSPPQRRLLPVPWQSSSLNVEPFWGFITKVLQPWAKVLEG